MTTTTRPRSSSPSSAADKSNKRMRQDGPSNSASSNATASIQVPSFDQLSTYRQKYQEATPYRHAVIPALFSDELLEGVVEESRTYGVRGEEGSLAGWGWEQKETDIYKQTPDLSSLDPEHLPDETLAALPQSTKLKNALYSQEFRNLVREVIGCGPLSGKRKDLSAGLYTQGSHLLLHDDSISTRLISFILYLPNSPLSAPSSSSAEIPLEPSSSGQFLKGWDPTWGGALELYPVENGEEVGLPGVKRACKVDVKWGQIIFFEVQPGRSYHSVEEVVVGDGRQRLGVSGWFHRPVEGEEGHEVLDDEKTKKDLSSLAQITSAPTIPFTPYTEPPALGLTPSHLRFLKDFLAPSYLSPSTLEKLSGQFVEASEIVLHNFLHPELAAALKSETESADSRDNVAGIPPQDLGEGDGWSIQGPTSKHRYLSLSSSTSASATTSSSSPTLQRILSTLLPSPAFRAWLSVVSSLAPTSYRTEARRFRKGLDYTLAAGEERSGEAHLDVWLGCTWWADVKPGSEEEDDLVEHGGWECYLAAPDEDEDPAVFQSSHAKKADGAASSNGNGKTGDHAAEEESEEDGIVEPHGEIAAEGGKPKATAGPSITMGGTELEFDPDQFSPSDFDSDSEHSEGDDGPLLTLPVGFNKLLLVLRDPGVMRFVKYLSAGAKGSRWDVGGEWEVGVMEEDEEEAGGDGEGETA